MLRSIPRWQLPLRLASLRHTTASTQGLFWRADLHVPFVFPLLSATNTQPLPPSSGLCPYSRQKVTARVKKATLEWVQVDSTDTVQWVQVDSTVEWVH